MFVFLLRSGSDDGRLIVVLILATMNEVEQFCRVS